MQPVNHVHAGDLFKVSGDETVYIAHQTGLIDKPVSVRNELGMEGPATLYPTWLNIENKPQVHLVLSKREQFAAMAMQGLLSSSKLSHGSEMAYRAVYLADELIKALNEKKS